MSAATSEVTASPTELSESISRGFMKGTFPMLVLFAGAVVQIFRHGGTGHYVFLALGALFSAGVLFAYAVLVSLKLKSGVRPGWGPMLVTFGAFIPYVFGCYLCLYEGLWRFLDLRGGFSFAVILLALAFTIGGYWLVSATHRISEIAKFEKVTISSTAAV